MKCKKIVALALTGVMTLALAAPAFAAGTSTKITGAFEDITISVSVKDTGKAVINPYSMPVKALADDGKAKLAELTTAGKIATNPLVMYNKTAINLSVGATVSATVPTTSGVELISTPVMATSTEKRAQVYLEVKRDNSLTSANISTTAAPATDICGIGGQAVIDAFNDWAATTYDRTAKNQILVSADEETTKENLAIMSACTDNSGTMVQNAGSFILYRLAGSVAKKPDVAWAETDTFDVNVAFTFSPLEPLQGGTITAKKPEYATNVFTVAKPTGLTDADLVGATYKWELLNKGDTDATAFAVANIAEPTLKNGSNPLGAGGTVTVKCTITLADGTMYASTDAVALT